LNSYKSSVESTRQLPEASDRNAASRCIARGEPLILVDADHVLVSQRGQGVLVQHFPRHGGEVDLCVKYPGFDVDLVFIMTSKVIADIWMGYSTIKRGIRNKKLALSGARNLKTSCDDWLNLSVFSNLQALADSLS
jgi:hypothetical protein